MPLNNKKKTPSRLKTAKRLRKIEEQTNWFNRLSKEEQKKILDSYKK